MNYEQELEALHSKIVTRPKTKKQTPWNMSSHAFLIPEVLFRPKLFELKEEKALLAFHEAAGDWNLRWQPSLDFSTGNLFSRIPQDIQQLIHNYETHDSPNGTGLGVHESVFHSIMQCEEWLRPHLWRNIQLTGGSALFPGLKERLEKELRSLAPPGIEVCVTAAESWKREHAVWIGASRMVGEIISESEISVQWITSEEYWETGPDIGNKLYSLQTR